MDTNYDRIEAVLDRGHTADGSMLFIQVLDEDGRTRTLGLTPQRAVEFLVALHFVSHRAELERDNRAAQGRAHPHTFITVESTRGVETFDPARVGVRLNLPGDAILDFALAPDVAQALCDQVIAVLSAGKQDQALTH
jgi:hypothetical protein